MRKVAVYITGDKHGDFTPGHQDYDKVKNFCLRQHTTKDDYLIVLGDHGCQFYPEDDSRTHRAMRHLEDMPITFILLRGNHDRRINRASAALRYVTLCSSDVTGEFCYHKDYPSVLFTNEYGAYRFAGHEAFVLCGAYSIDKQARLEAEQSCSYPLWFSDEQLSSGEWERAWKEYKNLVSQHHADLLILSHTCPLQYRPAHALLCQFDGLEEDTTMEQWMDKIADYREDGATKPWIKWYCGHFHTDEGIDNVRFMYHDILEVTPMNKQARIYTKEELLRICASDQDMPIWIQSRDGILWTAILDFNGAEPVAVYGIDLVKPLSSYGTDWIAWTQKPTQKQLNESMFKKSCRLLGGTL